MSDHGDAAWEHALGVGRFAPKATDPMPTDVAELAKVTALRAEEGADALGVVADLREQLAKAQAEAARWQADYEERAKAYAAVYEELTALRQGRA